MRYSNIIPKVLVLLMFVAAPSIVGAANAWYYGKISRIYSYNGGFVLTFDTTALDDCLWKYVYFQDSTIGQKTVDRALSLAMAAEAQGREVGVVIDKSINGVGGHCNSNGSIDMKK